MPMLYFPHYLRIMYTLRNLVLCNEICQTPESICVDQYCYLITQQAHFYHSYIVLEFAPQSYFIQE